MMMSLAFLQGTCQLLGTKATPRLSSFSPKNLVCHSKYIEIVFWQLNLLLYFQQLCHGAESAQNLTGQEANATSECASHDINMVCNPDTSIPGGVEGRCECRPDMKWNNEAKECQVCQPWSINLPINCCHQYKLRLLFSWPSRSSWTLIVRR